MPEALKKAYRRVVRNSNGIGLRVAFFDAETGAELSSLEGYTVIDQGVNPPVGADTPSEGSTNTDSDSSSGGGGGSSSDNSNYWKEWYENPNVSKGSGNIIEDLKAAFHTASDLKRDIPLNVKGTVAEALGLTTADPVGFLSKSDYNKVQEFKTGATDEAIPTTHGSISPNVVEGTSTGKSYDSTVGSQLVSTGNTSNGVSVPNVSDGIRSIGEAIDVALASVNPKETMLKIVDGMSDQEVGNFATIMGEASGKPLNIFEAATLAVAPGVARGPLKESLDSVPVSINSNLAEIFGNIGNLAETFGNSVNSVQQVADFVGRLLPPPISTQSSGSTYSQTPIPATKTQGIIDQQNAPNVQAAVAAAKKTNDPLEVAKAWLGYDEANPEQAQALSAFFTKAGISDPSTGGALDPNKTAWCAAWLNGVLFESGIEGSGSPVAKSFLDVGESVGNGDVQVGDIIVLDRPATNATWDGHVGIVSSINPDGTYQVLGGNQNNSVSISTYGANNVVGFRRVTKPAVEQELNDPNVMQAIAKGQTSIQEEVSYVNPRLASVLESLNKSYSNQGFPTPTPPVAKPPLTAADGLVIPWEPTHTTPTSLPSSAVNPSSFVNNTNTNMQDDLMAAAPTTKVDDVGAIDDAFGGSTNTSSQASAYAPNTEESTKDMTGPYSLNDKERERILVQTVLGEASGEGVEGMLAVANVIKNRALSGAYPPDPKDVATQKKQFSAWNAVSEGGNNPAATFPVGSPEYKEALKIVQSVFNNTMPDNTYGSLQFHTNNITPYWADEAITEGVGAMSIGNHTFYPTKEPSPVFTPASSFGAKEAFMTKQPDKNTPIDIMPASGGSSRSSPVGSMPSFGSLSNFSSDASSNSSPVGSMPSFGSLSNFSSDADQKTTGLMSKASDGSNVSSNTSIDNSAKPTSDSNRSSSTRSSASTSGSYTDIISNSVKSTSDKNASSSSSSSGFMAGPTSTKTTNSGTGTTTTKSTSDKNAPTSSTPKSTPSNSTLNSFM